MLPNGSLSNVVAQDADAHRILSAEWLIEDDRSGDGAPEAHALGITGQILAALAVTRKSVSWAAAARVKRHRRQRAFQLCRKSGSADLHLAIRRALPAITMRSAGLERGAASSTDNSRVRNRIDMIMRIPSSSGAVRSITV